MPPGDSTFTISDFDTLKIIADPLRAQIFELLIQAPGTVRQVAERLGQSASKLYYHFGLLEKAGLIEVVETRMVANMLEKQYQATAENIEVDRGLLTFTTDAGKEHINTMLASTLDHTREDILRSLAARYFALDQGAEAHPRQVMLDRVLSRLPDERALEFLMRLQALIREFAAETQPPAAQSDPGLQTYALTIAFYPSFYYPEDQPDD